MPSTTSPTVIAVFASSEEAHLAIVDLREAGFADADIGVSARPLPPGASPPSAPTWEYGAGVGGLAGASAGGLAAGPPGLLAGGVVGLLVGALVDFGVNEADARRYESEAAAGRTVVAVRAVGRHAEAREILTRHGGRELAG
jgi:hypothetical protein